jgi:hypothetical protein
MASPDPKYDLRAALDTLLPGVNVQRQLMDAAAQQYAAGGYVPLTAATALACLAIANTLDTWTPPDNVPPTINGTYSPALPAYPTQLPRFADSNPDPLDGWVEFGPVNTAPA